MNIVVEHQIMKAENQRLAIALAQEKAEVDRLRDVVRTAIQDLLDLDEVPYRDPHTTLAFWLSVQVQPQQRQCPLLSLMAGERPVLPEAV